MKKVFSVAFIAILSLTAILYSCQKPEEIANFNNSNDVISSQMQRSVDSAYFNLNMIEFIGKEHNRICKLIFNNFRSNTNQSLYTSFNSVMSSEEYGSLSEDGFNHSVSIYSNINIETTMNELLNNIQNDGEKSIISDLYDVTSAIQTYDEYIQHLSVLANRANNLTDQNRKIATLIALSVAKNSAKMWLSTNNGGEGYLDMGSPTGTSNKQISKAGGVIMADIVGAYSGFLGGVMGYLTTGGPVNPISNAYIAGCTLVGGIGASVGKALP